VPTADWPRIGGREELPSTADILASRAFRKAFRSRVAREIYLGLPPGCQVVSAASVAAVQDIDRVAGPAQ